MAFVNTLANIPIKVVDSNPTDPLALAKALLHEIQTMLCVLADTGHHGVLDLRALPALGEEGYQFLKEKLGVGEVSARIQGFGRSEIQETAFAGIWWVCHYNQDDHVYTELIEVTFLPQILRSHRDDVLLSQLSLDSLLRKLAKTS